MQGRMPWWFPDYHDLHRSVNLQKEQLSNQEQQTQTTGSIPRALWENGLHARFLQQRSQLAHSLLENEGSAGVPEALDPVELSCVLLMILVE